MDTQCIYKGIILLDNDYVNPAIRVKHMKKEQILSPPKHLIFSDLQSSQIL